MSSEIALGVSVATLISAVAACSSNQVDKKSVAEEDAAVADSGPLTVTAIEADPRTASFKVLSDGDDARLQPAPQGGFVIFVGALVKNLDTTAIELEAILRDPESGTVLAQRIVESKMVPTDEPGPLVSDYSSIREVAHLYLCPNYEPFDVVGHLYQLDLQATELGAQASTGSTSLRIKPVCPVADGGGLSCNCQCEAGYTPEKCSIETLLDAG